MKKYNNQNNKTRSVFVGIDLHKESWHVTVLTAEGEELFNGGIRGRWDALQKILDRHRQYQIHAVYEAGFMGFWLYDVLMDYGIECTVTPPSLIPMEYGNRVKTDRRDSKKLAYFLAKGMLKKVWVPSKEQRDHRQVIRRRRQLVHDRVRTQNRIKSTLRFYGIRIPEPVGKWSRLYLINLKRIKFKDQWIQRSFDQLLATYTFQAMQVEQQTQLIKELSDTEGYREKVKILKSVPGIGVLSAMEVLLELGDIRRFSKGDKLAAYVGLTPSQYSSGEHVRMGRICKAGKNGLRATLIEVSWKLIAKDPAMREKYNNIKARAGGKRAIVAIARRLLLRVRCMLINKQPYLIGVIA